MDTHREAAGAMRRAASRMHELRHELGEANAEIDRHHRDFKLISAILDEFDANVGSNWYTRQIRNIVG